MSSTSYCRSRDWFEGELYEPIGMKQPCVGHALLSSVFDSCSCSLTIFSLAGNGHRYHLNDLLGARVEIPQVIKGTSDSHTVQLEIYPPGTKTSTNESITRQRLNQDPNAGNGGPPVPLGRWISRSCMILGFRRRVFRGTGTGS